MYETAWIDTHARSCTQLNPVLSRVLIRSESTGFTKEGNVLQVFYLLEYVVYSYINTPCEDISHVVASSSSAISEYLIKSQLKYAVEGS